MNNAEGTYFSVKVRFSSQVMMGRFFLSLYVGRMTEYLSELFCAMLMRWRVLEAIESAGRGRVYSMRSK